MSAGSDHSYRASQRRVESGACVVLRAERQVFMIERIGSHGSGTWSFPGGWIEPNESAEETACREAWEEVGVTIDPNDLEFLGYTNDHHPEGFSGLTLWFATTRWEGRPRGTNPDRIRQTEWVDITDLDETAVWRRGPMFEPVRNALRKGVIAP